MGRCGLALAVALCGGFAGEGRAGGVDELPPVIGATELFSGGDRSGLALHGFDPVSYFLGAPRPGRADLEMLWSGLAWRFANDANRAAFARDPDAYAPRLGGYDARGIARDLLVGADPGRFETRSGRLYLFRSEESRRAFLAESALAETAEARWLEMKGRLVQP